MLFEIALMICAAVLYINIVAKRCKDVNNTKQFAVSFVMLPILSTLLIGRPLSVTEMIYGYTAIFVITCLSYLLGVAGSVSENICYVVKSVVILLLYRVIIRNYAPDIDNIGKEIVELIYIGLSSLWLISERIKEWLEDKHQYAYFGALAAAAPVLCFYIIENTYNGNLDALSGEYVIENFWWLAILAVIVCCLIPKKKLAIGLCMTVSLIFGAGNYYVGQFRGSPIMPTDLLSLGTAFQVAGGYEFEITESIIVGVLLWYAGMVLLCCIPEKKADMGWIVRAVAGGMAVCICMGYLSSVKMQDPKLADNENMFDVTALYRRKGSVLAFISLASCLHTEKPDGYSADKIEEIFLQISSEKSVQEENNRSAVPTIITIMDESFSDLRTLGDFECSDEYLMNWNAIDKYVCKGRLYVSVYGGNTANSEFEFLTGGSMGNIPTGVVPYQFYNLKDVGNLADILSSQGYTVTAVHPEYKGNWNRMRTYANFGFQDFLGMNDFEDPMRIRDHVSDESSFDKVIELYEKNRGQRQFIFNVTMQNHGGYNIKSLAGYDTVKLKEEWQNYTDVETYLTLIRESDKAIHKLITYFQNVEEPVILCIFGDHLPRMNESWVQEVMGKSEDKLVLEELERKYAVPYMIWSNYEIPGGHLEMDTSPNYLGALLLKYAGVQGTDYTDYLLKMSEIIPVMNAFGYRTSDGVWHSYKERTEVSEWIDNYRSLQYNALFDAGRNMDHYRQGGRREKSL